jgi:hypothetical protein
MHALVSRRKLFSILPAGVAGCVGCAGGALGAAQAVAPAGRAGWGEKVDLTYEQLFRFSYQKEMIPLLKDLAAKLGKEKFLRLMEESLTERAGKGLASKPIPKRDLATFTRNMRPMPAMIRNTLEAEIVEDTPKVFAYRTKKCLWAKTFREEDAADIGYVLVCQPDIAVARGFNPKLKLTRTATLMQGQAECDFRYEMED